MNTERRTQIKNALIEAINLWIEQHGNVDRWVSAKVLFNEIDALYIKKPWHFPYSVLSLGGQLNYNLTLFSDLYGMEKRILGGERLYRFLHKNNSIETI